MKPTKLSKQIGAAISLHRKIRGKTQKWLGEKVGLCESQIGLYESGKHQIKVATLVKISQILRVKFAKLLPQDLIDPRLKVRKDRGEL